MLFPRAGRVKIVSLSGTSTRRLYESPAERVVATFGGGSTTEGFGIEESLNRLNSCRLASSFRARAAELSKLKPGEVASGADARESCFLAGFGLSDEKVVPEPEV